MIDAVVFHFRFVERVDPGRQQTEMRKCHIWAARGEIGIYRTRAEQLSLGPEQPLVGFILQNRLTAAFKVRLKKAAALIQRKNGLAFRQNPDPYPGMHNIYGY